MVSPPVCCPAKLGDLCFRKSCSDRNICLLHHFSLTSLAVLIFPKKSHGCHAGCRVSRPLTASLYSSKSHNITKRILKPQSLLLTFSQDAKLARSFSSRHSDCEPEFMLQTVFIYLKSIRLLCTKYFQYEIFDLGQDEGDLSLACGSSSCCPGHGLRRLWRRG